MIGNLNPSHKKAIVVGAGISGLIIAYTLKKRGFQVKVLEASSRSGGLLATPDVQAFFKELGIPLLSLKKHSKARYIYRNKKMRRMPLSFLEIISTLFHFFSKPKFQLNLETASLSEWCNAYLGTPALRYLFTPFVTGIFASHPSELHAKTAFPKLIPTHPESSLFSWFRQKKKMPRPQMMTPSGGMEELVRRLTAALKDEIQYHTSVHSIEEKNTNLIFTIPSSELSKLISKLDPASAEALLKVRYAPLITITCFYRRADFKTEPRGVGALIPPGEGLRLLGCLFNSSSFDLRVKEKEYVSLTVMLGGTKDPDVLNLSDSEIECLIDQELRTLLGSTAKPSYCSIHRWQRAIPIYSRELTLARLSLKSGLCAYPGILVFNNYSKEVSIRGLIELAHQI